MHLAGKLLDAICTLTLVGVCGVLPIVEISYAVVKGCQLIDWAQVIR